VYVERKARQKKKKNDFSHFSSSHNTVVRTFCMHCYMSLMDASPKTADCRLGGLCGCGARYCSIKCLVAASQAHKVVCELAQPTLQVLAESRFRGTHKTQRVAVELLDHVQLNLLAADMVIAASDAAVFLVHAAESLHNTEVFELAQKFAQRALSQVAKGTLGEADALEMLGHVALGLSKYDAAVLQYEAALNIRKKLLGSEHVEVAKGLSSLSAVLQRLGRLNEALAICSSALEIYSKAPGDKQVSLPACHLSMGIILRQQGKNDEAMEHFSTGLKITLKRDGETSMAADFLNSMGVVSLNLNKLDEAMEKYVSALRIFEKAKNDVSVAICHQNIGRVLVQQGKIDAALEHARKALEIGQSKLSVENINCGDSHFLIGNIFQASGKFAEAVDEYENALRIRKNVYGEMSLDVAEVYQNLALCFVELRKWREAVPFFEATIHIRTVLLGAHDAALFGLKASLAAVVRQVNAERSSTAAPQ
jgi:tetratricopeptide (TPR) repeat protein